MGCVPSKFLIHHARVAHEARTASRFGVHGDRVRVGAFVREKRSYVDHHRAES